MSLRLLLVRHGEAAARWGEDPDPGLSATGREQADRVADRLTDSLPQDVQILSSPMLRAKQTATPLAATLGVTPIIDKRFCEVPAPVAFEQRANWIRHFMAQRWSEQPGEIQQWRAGILGGLQSLRLPTVVFTHFVVINAVVSALTGNDRTMVFQPDYTSVTTLSKQEGELSLVSTGDTKKTRVN